jgi:hypothetical protein
MGRRSVPAGAHPAIRSNVSLVTRHGFIDSDNAKPRQTSSEQYQPE